MNGRVKIEQPDINVLFQLQDKQEVEVKDFRGALKGIWENTQLSQLFFSTENMIMVQDQLRNGVYKMSGKQYVIGIQSYDDLKIIMRDIFLHHSNNTNKNITREITRLNNIVLKQTIKNVYNEVNSYLKYLEDASTMYKPMQHPVDVNSYKDVNYKKELL